jgi:hypothetical protein
LPRFAPTSFPGDTAERPGLGPRRRARLPLFTLCAAENLGSEARAGNLAR